MIRSIYIYLLPEIEKRETYSSILKPFDFDN